MTLTKTSEDERRPHTFENTYSGLRAHLRVAIVVLAPGVGIRSSGTGDALKAEEEESIEADIGVPEDSMDYTDPDTGKILYFR